MMQLEQNYALVGPTVTIPVQDPLAVLLLDNRLCIKSLKFCCKVLTGQISPFLGILLRPGLGL